MKRAHASDKAINAPKKQQKHPVPVPKSSPLKDTSNATNTNNDGIANSSAAAAVVVPRSIPRKHNLNSLSGVETYLNLVFNTFMTTRPAHNTATHREPHH